MTLKPAHHFATQFAGVHWLVRYRGGTGPFTEDSTTVAEYCGYSAENLEPPSAMSLTNLNTSDWRMRQVRALLEVLEARRDDAGEPVRVDAGRLAQAKACLQRLWPGNPVQWYLSYHTFRQAEALLYDAVLTEP